MLTQGRLVPRQPWAIKGTTPTALHRCNIYNGMYIQGNIGIISAALPHEPICSVKHMHRVIIIKHAMLRAGNIHSGRYNHWNTGTKPTVLPHEGIDIAKHMYRKIIMIHMVLTINKTYFCKQLFNYGDS